VTAPLGTLAEIDAAIARAEATLADYRQDLAERAAEGRDTARPRELVRLVEKRPALLHERRRIAEATEGSGGSGSREGWRP
jgi:hypothetical protein